MIICTRIFVEIIASIQSRKRKLQYFGIMTSPRGNMNFGAPGGSTYRDYAVNFIEMCDVVMCDIIYLDNGIFFYIFYFSSITYLIIYTQ